MIPPLPNSRHKSISRWLMDHPTTPLLSSAALEDRVRELDEQMMEAFESREDSLKESMIQRKTWGTAEGIESFPTDRMTLWAEVVDEFLPTTDPASED